MTRKASMLLMGLAIVAGSASTPVAAQDKKTVALAQCVWDSDAAVGNSVSKWQLTKNPAEPVRLSISACRAKPEFAKLKIDGAALIKAITEIRFNRAAQCIVTASPTETATALKALGSDKDARVSATISSGLPTWLAQETAKCDAELATLIAPDRNNQAWLVDALDAAVREKR